MLTFGMGLQFAPACCGEAAKKGSLRAVLAGGPTAECAQRHQFPRLSRAPYPRARPARRQRAPRGAQNVTRNAND